MTDSNEQVPGCAPVEAEKRVFLDRRHELIRSFVEAAEGKKLTKMGRVYLRLRQTNEFLRCLERIEQALPHPAQYSATSNRYVVSSLFLHECFRLLTADRDEQFFFITGSILGGTYVLDHRLEFLHAKRSVVGVVGNHADTHRLLIKLEQYGHRLLGHFHSHPGNGLESTKPSGTDTGFQERLEEAGYPTVAAIFSRDGYVRFFRLNEEVEVQIYGTGVEQHGKNTFRLTAVS